MKKYAINHQMCTLSICSSELSGNDITINVSHCEKTCLRGFPTGQIQTGLYSQKNGKRLEISDLGRRGIVLSV